MLYGGDMKDDTGATFHHAWQQTPVEPHGRHQIEVQCLLPFIVCEHSEAAVGGAGATNAVHQDVDATPALKKPIHDLLHTMWCADVRLDKQGWLLAFGKR